MGQAEIIKKYFPDYEYLLYDFSPEGETESKGNTEVIMMLEMFRAIFIKETDTFMLVLKKVLKMVETLSSEDKRMYYHTALIVYIISVRQDMSKEKIVDMAEEVQKGRGMLL